MARELNEIFTSKTKKDEFTLSVKDWNELQSELSELRLQMKNHQGGVVFIYSKMIKLFDKVKNEIDRLNKKQKELEQYVKKSMDDIQLEITKQDKNKEEFIAHQVKNLIDQHHKLNQKYSFQLEDLCRSLTMQSEQVWKLSDQVKEIKEDLLNPPR